MKTFYQLLINVLLVGFTQNFLWFAVIYWGYIQTQSVLATSVMTGVYMILTAGSAFWFGSIVDYNEKKKVMMWSSLATLVFFIIGAIIYFVAPVDAFKTIQGPYIWIFMFSILLGVIAGNLRGICLLPLITMIVPEDQRDKANGMYGTTNGIIFSVVNVASGFALAFGGMSWVLIPALILSVLGIIHLHFLSLPKEKIEKKTIEEESKGIDVKGTIRHIKKTPGLMSLIFFNTFNNFLGGVFMPLMDPYGLSLVPLPVWSVMWAILSFSFIFGGMFVAKYGVGKNPVRTLFLGNCVMWVVCIFFTIQPSLILVIVGMLLWMSLIPFVEASEQTILQKVVPLERQGRVFGFASSIENLASPLTAFLIGPLTEFVFVPFMTSGYGAQTIGSWYGTGYARGIALVFSAAGVIGLIVTLITMRTKAYSGLSKKYQETAEVKVA